MLGLSVAAPIMAVSMLQLRVLIASDAQREYEFADYQGTRIITSALALGIIAIVAFASDWDATTVTIVLFVAVAKCADSLSDLARGLYQREERMDYSGMSLIVRGPLALLAAAAAILLFHRDTWTVAAMAMAWAVSYLIYDTVRIKWLLQNDRIHASGGSARPRFVWATMWRLTRVAFPLGLVMGIISLQTNIPRYALQHFAGEDSLGYFGAMAYPMAAFGMMANALGQTASPRLARMFLSNVAGYQRLTWKLSGVAAVLGVALLGGTWLLGEVFLTIYGPDYVAHHPAFVVLAGATAIQLVASCWGYALTAARSLRVQVPLVITTSFVTAFSSYLFVPRWCVMGAALSVLATTVFMLSLFVGATYLAMQRQRRVLAENESAVLVPKSVDPMQEGYKPVE